MTRCTNDAAKPQVFLQERYRDSKASGEPQPGLGHQTVTQLQAECPLLAQSGHPTALSDVRFSNRPFGVKHFQTVHRCSVDVTHGLVLLFGIGTKALVWGFFSQEV